MAQRKSTVSKKRQRLENLLERMEGGSEVSLRDFRNAISKDDLDNYEQILEQRRAFASATGNGSSGYNDLFKKGLLLYNRGEGYSGKNAKLSRKFYAQAETCFEKALEQLDSDVQLDPSIAMDYDRNLDRSSLSPDPLSMPRLRNSKSLDNLASGSLLLNKRGAKIQVLKEAIVKAKEEEGGAGKVQVGGAGKSVRQSTSSREPKLDEPRKKSGKSR